MKKLVRLTESDLHKIVKESVNEVLNELGDSDRIHNYLGTISGYYEAQGNSDKANRAHNLSTRLQKNRNNGQLYDPNSEESASEYRRNSYAYTNGFDKGWDKGRHQMEEATADPRWWQKDGEFPDMKDDYYRKPNPKQEIKVSEAQLHQIVKESVEQVLSEGWFGNDKRYGEKWWNPNTWMSDKEKREKDRIDKTLRDNYNKRKEWDKEREEAEYQRKMQISHQKHNTKTSPDVEKRTGYGDTTFGPADDGYFAGLR